MRKLPLFGHCSLNESVDVVRIRARLAPVQVWLASTFYFAFSAVSISTDVHRLSPAK